MRAATRLRRRAARASGVLVAFAAALLAAPPAIADDTADETVDAAQRLRLLSVPIILSEPAIGRGLGASLMLIHPRRETGDVLTRVDVPDTEVELSDGQLDPPDVTAVFGAYTEDDTWVAGAVHAASWKADRLRYVGALMATNVNATVFVLDRPVGFNSRGEFLLQSLSARIGSSRLFLGGKVKLNRSETDLRLDFGGNDPIEVGLGDTTDVGLSVQGFFDSRDTTFTPSHGRFVRLEVWRHDTSFGGDFDYWKGSLKALSFHPLGAATVLGLRLEGAAVSGEPPFWGYPWITIRGVPAMRYQDERTVAAEAEIRWNFRSRWAVVGFLGGGATDGGLVQFESQDPLVAGGVGVRYLFASDLGLWVGGDIARGPEDDIWYIQVGHAW